MGNVTWTADVMQNYSGNITWVAYEYAIEPIPGDLDSNGATEARFFCRKRFQFCLMTLPILYTPASLPTSTKHFWKDFCFFAVSFNGLSGHARQ